jgi:hypothetical protein
MSANKEPTSPWVLPMYYYMESSMKEALQKDGLDQRIKNGLFAALSKLDKYYEMAKENKSYIIATGESSEAIHSEIDYISLVCHPALRMRWFKKNWTSGDYAFASSAFQEAYDEYCSDMPAPVTPTPQPSAPKIHQTDLWAKVAGLGDDSDTEVSSPPPPHVQPEPELYEALSMPRSGEFAHQSLQWWKVCHLLLFANILECLHYTGESYTVPCALKDGQGLPGHSCNLSISGEAFFQC